MGDSITCYALYDAMVRFLVVVAILESTRKQGTLSLKEIKMTI